MNLVIEPLLNFQKMDILSTFVSSDKELYISLTDSIISILKIYDLNNFQEIYSNKFDKSIESIYQLKNGKIILCLKGKIIIIKKLEYKKYQTETTIIEIKNPIIFQVLQMENNNIVYCTNLNSLCIIDSISYKTIKKITDFEEAVFSILEVKPNIIVSYSGFDCLSFWNLKYFIKIKELRNITCIIDNPMSKINNNLICKVGSNSIVIIDLFDYEIKSTKKIYQNVLQAIHVFQNKKIIVFYGYEENGYSFKIFSLSSFNYITQIFPEKRDLGNNIHDIFDLDDNYFLIEGKKDIKRCKFIF